MYFLRAILLAQLVVTCVLAQRVQEWGQLGPSGFLLHEQQIQVLQQSGHNGTAILRRTIQYPDFVEDESIPIAFIRISHYGEGEDTEAELRWGGPGYKHAGIDLTGAPGQKIQSTLQIFA